MTAKIPDSPAARRFFGRRKGHRLRAHQAELIETLLPRLALDLRQPAAEPLTALFPVPVTEVRLEIGFGGGEHLIAEAGRNPHIGFLGCEPFVNGMAKALAVIETEDLKNIRLHLGDAVPVLSWLPAGALPCVGQSRGRGVRVGHPSFAQEAGQRKYPHRTRCRLHLSRSNCRYSYCRGRREPEDRTCVGDASRLRA